MFHSAHWDHDHDIAGRKVAVLGTGASAIQFVPAIAPQVERLTVFQRSAPWVLPKSDRAYPERTKRLHARVPALTRLWRRGWWAWMESLVPMFTRRPPRTARAMTAFYRTLANVHRAAQLRGDRRLMAATRPNYAIGCKRVLITSDWYPTLRRDNVDLVTDPIREVVADGIVTEDGRHHPADTILFGTGFTATEFLAPMEVEGRDGPQPHGGMGPRRRGLPRHHRPRLPQHVPALRAQHQPRHRLGDRADRGPGEVRGGRRPASGQRARRSGSRCAARSTMPSRASCVSDLDDSVWATCSSWYVTAEGRVTNHWPGTQTEYRRRTRAVALGDYHVRAPVADPV